MNKETGYRDRRRGFTLTELLVVISVICLLMVISLPMLTNAREQGRRTQCMADLRTLTQGWSMYAMENDDKLCSARTDWDVPPDNHWVADGPVIPGNTVGGTAQAIGSGVLWPYVAKELDVYHCASDRSERLRSYAIAISMNGYPPTAPKDSPLRSFRRWSEISYASQRMVFIDALCHTPWIDGPFSYMMVGGKPRWRFSIRCAITARHSNGCNLSLADGHCEYWKYRDPRTIALAKHPGRGMSRAASGENRDLLRLTEWIPGRND